MQVKFIMTMNVECVSPEATIQDAACLMKSLDIGALAVCSDNGRLVGVLTDRDIVIRASADGLDPTSARVGDAMTENAIYCFEDQDVKEAVRLMEDHLIRRLVVLNRKMELVGIVSLGDLAIRADKKDATEVLKEVSALSPAHV
jgi:CBS domain-containing protein